MRISHPFVGSRNTRMPLLLCCLGAESFLAVAAFGMHACRNADCCCVIWLHAKHKLLLVARLSGLLPAVACCRFMTTANSVMPSSASARPAPRRDYLEARQVSLFQLFDGNDFMFDIPAYQRPYSWRNKQVGGWAAGQPS